MNNPKPEERPVQTSKKPSWPKGSKEKVLREKARHVVTLLGLKQNETVDDYNFARRMQGVIGPGGTYMTDADIDKGLDRLIAKYGLEFPG